MNLSFVIKNSEKPGLVKQISINVFSISHCVCLKTKAGFVIKLHVQIMKPFQIGIIW